MVPNATPYNEDLNRNGSIDIVSEDVNGNGQMDIGEDLNGNNTLDLSVSEDLNNDGVLTGNEPTHADYPEVKRVVATIYK